MLKFSRKLQTYRNIMPKLVALFLVIVGLVNTIMPMVLKQQRTVEQNVELFVEALEMIPADLALLTTEQPTFFETKYVSIILNKTYMDADKTTIPNKVLYMDGTEATLVINGAAYHTKFTEVMNLQRAHVVYTFQHLLKQVTISAFISGVAKSIGIEVLFVSVVLMLIYFGIYRTEKYQAILSTILPFIGGIYSLAAIVYVLLPMPYLIFFTITHLLAVFISMSMYWEKYIDIKFLGRNSEYGG